MRQPEYPHPVETTDSIAELIPSPADTFKSILDFTRRQYPVIAFAVAIAVALGFTYVLTTPPSFTATTTMMIDSKKVQLFQQQSIINDLPIDAATVESQVEILKSETIAQAVIDKLHLGNDPEFTNPGGGLVGTLLGAVTWLFTSSEPVSEFALKRAAIGAFEHGMSIRRIGLTYVIVISFQAYHPDRAAEIANAIANAYIDDQLEAKFELGAARVHLVASAASRIAGASFNRGTRRRCVQEQERNGRYRWPHNKRAAACRAEQRTCRCAIANCGGAREARSGKIGARALLMLRRRSLTRSRAR